MHCNGIISFLMKYLFVFLCCILSHGAFAQHDVPPTSSFEISGLVKKKLKINIADLKRMKQYDLGDVVIRNHKGDPKHTAKQLKGILLRTLLDSAEITADKPKEYSEYAILLTASDGYKNVYSWNEIYNTEVGNRVYIITEIDEQTIDNMKDRILVLSQKDINSGRRRLKGLAKVEVKQVQ